MKSSDGSRVVAANSPGPQGETPPGQLSDDALRFLADASLVLMSDMDYQATMQNVAHLLVPSLADWCLIDLIESDERIQTVGRVHSDPQRQAVIDELARRYWPEFRREEHITPAVLRTGQARLVPEISVERLQQSGYHPEHLRLLQELGLWSLMVVPLQVRGKVLGAVVLALTGQDARRYSEADLALAGEVARRAALAIDNARLYQQVRAAEHAIRTTNEQTSLLQSVSMSLSGAITTSEISRLIVEQGKKVFGCRSVTVLRLTPDQTALEILDALGLDHNIVEEYRLIPVNVPSLVVEALETKQPIWIENLTDPARGWFERFPIVRETYSQMLQEAIATIPLMQEDRAVGVMVLGFDLPRSFAPADQALMMVLGQQCAQALERARLFDAVQLSHAQAEQNQTRLTFLSQASDVLGRSLDYASTLQRLANLLVPGIADWCSVYMIEQDQPTGAKALKMMAVAHTDPQKAELARQFRERHPVNLNQSGWVAAVVRTGLPEMVPHLPVELLKQNVTDPEYLEFLLEVGLTGWITAPMIVRGEVIGAIVLATATSKRQFTEADMELVSELARRAAAAIDNARLYQAEQLSYRQAERARRQVSFLAGASKILSSSLDYYQTLEALARLTLPELGDYCIIDMLNRETGALERVALAHVDPAKERLMNETQRRYPPDPHSPVGIPRAMRTGQTEFAEQIDPEALRIYSRNEEHFEVLKFLAPTSGISVPITGHNGVIGVLSLALAGTSRRYTPDDIAVAEELARRAAVAVENSRLYHEAQEAVRLRDEFLSVAAHELKTPVTNLRGHSQLVTRRIDRNGVIEPQQVRRALQVIIEQSNKLNLLVEQLLDVSRLGAGRMQLNPAPTDLVELARSVAEAARLSLQSADPAAPAHDITVRVPSGPAQVMVEADRLRIEQVMSNLLTNAIKYSPEGGPVVLEVSLNPASGQPGFSVEDRGIGIAPENRERLFERFYQAHPNRYASGMGLGLYICRQIVSLHGGTIEAEFPPEGGTRIVVLLPAPAPD